MTDILNINADKTAQSGMAARLVGLLAWPFAVFSGVMLISAFAPVCHAACQACPAAPFISASAYGVVLAFVILSLQAFPRLNPNCAATRHALP